MLYEMLYYLKKITVLVLFPFLFSRILKTGKLNFDKIIIITYKYVLHSKYYYIFFQQKIKFFLFTSSMQD